MQYLSKHKGLTLSEIIITLVILITLSTFTILKFSNSSNETMKKAAVEATKESVVNIIKKADGELGFLPDTMGPATILSKYNSQYELKASIDQSTIQEVANAPLVPGNAPTDPTESASIVVDGQQVYTGRNFIGGCNLTTMPNLWGGAKIYRVTEGYLLVGNEWNPNNGKSDFCYTRNLVTSDSKRYIMTVDRGGQIQGQIISQGDATQALPLTPPLTPETPAPPAATPSVPADPSTNLHTVFQSSDPQEPLPGSFSISLLSCKDVDGKEISMGSDPSAYSAQVINGKSLINPPTGADSCMLVVGGNGRGEPLPGFVTPEPREVKFSKKGDTYEWITLDPYGRLGVLVNLTSQCGGSSPGESMPVKLECTNGDKRTGTTNSKGVTEFAGLTPGIQCSLSTSKQNYESANTGYFTVPSGSFSKILPLISQRANLEVAIKKKNLSTGQVTDMDTDTLVSLNSSDTKTGKSKVTFPDLTIGQTYTVNASTSGYQFMEGSLTVKLENTCNTQAQVTMGYYPPVNIKAKVKVVTALQPWGDITENQPGATVTVSAIPGQSCSITGNYTTGDNGEPMNFPSTLTHDSQCSITATYSDYKKVSPQPVLLNAGNAENEKRIVLGKTTGTLIVNTYSQDVDIKGETVSEKTPLTNTSVTLTCGQYSKEIASSSQAFVTFADVPFSTYNNNTTCQITQAQASGHTFNLAQSPKFTFSNHNQTQDVTLNKLARATVTITVTKGAYNGPDRGVLPDTKVSLGDQSVLSDDNGVAILKDVPYGSDLSTLTASHSSTNPVYTYIKPKTFPAVDQANVVVPINMGYYLPVNITGKIKVVTALQPGATPVNQPGASVTVSAEPGKSCSITGIYRTDDKGEPLNFPTTLAHDSECLIRATYSNYHQVSNQPMVLNAGNASTEKLFILGKTTGTLIVNTYSQDVDINNNPVSGKTALTNTSVTLKCGDGQSQYINEITSSTKNFVTFIDVPFSAYNNNTPCQITQALASGHTFNLAQSPSFTFSSNNQNQDVTLNKLARATVTITVKKWDGSDRGVLSGTRVGLGTQSVVSNIAGVATLIGVPYGSDLSTLTASHSSSYTYIRPTSFPSVNQPNVAFSINMGYRLPVNIPVSIQVLSKQEPTGTTRPQAGATAKIEAVAGKPCSIAGDYTTNTNGRLVKNNVQLTVMEANDECNVTASYLDYFKESPQPVVLNRSNTSETIVLAKRTGTLTVRTFSQDVDINGTPVTGSTPTPLANTSVELKCGSYVSSKTATSTAASVIFTDVPFSNYNNNNQCQITSVVLSGSPQASDYTFNPAQSPSFTFSSNSPPRDVTLNKLARATVTVTVFPFDTYNNQRVGTSRLTTPTITVGGINNITTSTVNGVATFSGVPYGTNLNSLTATSTSTNPVYTYIKPNTFPAVNKPTLDVPINMGYLPKGSVTVSIQQINTKTGTPTTLTSPSIKVVFNGIEMTSSNGQVVFTGIDYGTSFRVSSVSPPPNNNANIYEVDSSSIQSFTVNSPTRNTTLKISFTPSYSLPATVLKVLNLQSPNGVTIPLDAATVSLETCNPVPILGTVCFPDSRLLSNNQTNGSGNLRQGIGPIPGNTKIRLSASKPEFQQGQPNFVEYSYEDQAPKTLTLNQLAGGPINVESYQVQRDANGLDICPAQPLSGVAVTLNGSAPNSSNANRSVFNKVAYSAYASNLKYTVSGTINNYTLIQNAANANFDYNQPNLTKRLDFQKNSGSNLTLKFSVTELPSNTALQSKVSVSCKDSNNNVVWSKNNEETGPDGIRTWDNIPYGLSCNASAQRSGYNGQPVVFTSGQGITDKCATSVTQDVNLTLSKNPGTLVIKVIDSIGSLPLRDENITISYPLNGGTQKRTLATDSNGLVRFSGTPLGIWYDVSAEKDIVEPQSAKGYFGIDFTDDIPELTMRLRNGFTTSVVATVKNKLTNRPEKDVIISLKPPNNGGSISGVTESPPRDGVMPPDEYALCYMGSCGKTGADGKVTFSNIFVSNARPSGWELKTLKTGFPQLTQNIPFTANGASRYDINLELNPNVKLLFLNTPEQANSPQEENQGAYSIATYLKPIFNARGLPDMNASIDALMRESNGVVAALRVKLQKLNSVLNFTAAQINNTIRTYLRQDNVLKPFITRNQESGSAWTGLNGDGTSYSDGQGLTSCADYQRMTFYQNGVAYTGNQITCDANDFPKIKNATSTAPVYIKNGETYNLLVATVDISKKLVSPLKINLMGQNATVNSDNRFWMDVDGHKSDIAKPFQTTGGLNPYEAWLVLDRSQNGFYHMGFLDGEDVFGDHLGQYKNGYEDLRWTLHKWVKQDKYGKNYIALKPLSQTDKLWIELTRMVGLNRDINPNYDLKLLTQSGTEMQASDWIERIDVSYWNVQEFDKSKRNAILQRAWVKFNNGKKAQSADQWFQRLKLYKPLSPEEVEGLQKQGKLPKKAA